MNDLRRPTGLLFSILGIVLLIYAAINPAAHAPLTGANVNLWCGLVLLGFGGTLLWLSRHAN
jgi:hypothetical protein